MNDAAVRDEPEQSRYILEQDGGIAIAAYRRRGNVIVFTHTEVPEELEGHGVASRLIAGALADVRAKGLTIEPACSFVAAYLERHPDQQDLIAR